ncbi:MAG: CpaF family protein [Anaerolineales bacterium]
MTRRDYLEIEDRLHRLTSNYVLTQLKNEADRNSLVEDREELTLIIWQLLKKQNEILPQAIEKEVIQAVVNRIKGLGPIEPLLHNSDITEIMVNTPNEVFIEKQGKLERIQINFRNDEHIINVIDRIVAPLGRRVDQSMPFVDARLPDGSRVNAIIPPLALRSPALTIRRFSTTPFTLTRLVKMETLNVQMAQFLQACVRTRINILISGGTGSGKTSTLNALARCIPEGDRLVTIEDVAELQLLAKNIVVLEARPPNLEGKGEITIRVLVRNALRMRPDRIIVGEVRGPEAFDMLQAMNTGHPGSLTTIHANSPADALHRLESMVLMADMDLPQPVIREQVASSVNLILQQERLPGGKRKIVSIAEILTTNKKQEENITVLAKDIFKFSKEGLDGQGQMMGKFHTTGYIPRCLEIIKYCGISLQDELGE